MLRAGEEALLGCEAGDGGAGGRGVGGDEQGERAVAEPAELLATDLDAVPAL
ncbi:hypothetical protein ACVGVM_26040 [Pseudonocardia bannensis]|uniref:Uncharacterized protein n=1 Tax=Pseudonocardia bannensis TaxID=630973 RepID=A0A848DPF5_9PSEU|nr:hypothetical protein [Pseudonocardia bannensis]NMH94389.1 hypothetical protein [Pseudonocardia bannensis]